MKKQLQKILALLSIVSIWFLSAAVTVDAAATTEIEPTYISGRFYVFQNMHSGKFLEVADGNITAGTTVWQDAFNFDSNLSQVFRIWDADEADIEDIPDDEKIASDEEYFTVLPYSNSNFCLDVDNANDANGVNIKIYGHNSGYGAQSFWFQKNSDGTCYIRPFLSRESNRVLTVVNSSSSNKANVVLSSCTGSSSQKWVIKEINLENDQDPQLIGLNWSYFFRGDTPSERRISQRVDMRPSVIDTRHTGIDLPMDEGTPIYSPCAGRVIEIGVEGDNLAESMGNYVTICSTDTITVGSKEVALTIRMMHMRDKPKVTVNDTVTVNTVLGLVGDTGQSYGEHLHIDINIKNYTGGNAIRNNPQYVINPEKLLLSKRFRYGPIASTATLATDYIFYPDWEQAM